MLKKKGRLILPYTENAKQVTGGEQMVTFMQLTCGT